MRAFTLYFFRGTCLLVAAFLLPAVAAVGGDEPAQALGNAMQAYEAHLDEPDIEVLHERALVAAALAADADPADARPYWLMGNLYMRLGENRLALELAEESLRIALDLSPADARIQLSLGECLFMQRQFHAARMLWLELLATQDPGAISATLLAQTMQAYLLNDDLEAGLQELPVLRSQNPGNRWLAALHGGLVSVKHRLGPTDESREQLQELRRWWQQQPEADELQNFVLATWLELP